MQPGLPSFLWVYWTIADRNEPSAQSSQVIELMLIPGRMASAIFSNIGKGLVKDRIASKISEDSRTVNSIFIRLSRLLFILYHRREDDALAKIVECRWGYLF